MSGIARRLLDVFHPRCDRHCAGIRRVITLMCGSTGITCLVEGAFQWSHGPCEVYTGWLLKNSVAKIPSRLFQDNFVLFYYTYARFLLKIGTNIQLVSLSIPVMFCNQTHLPWTLYASVSTVMCLILFSAVRTSGDTVPSLSKFMNFNALLLRSSNFARRSLRIFSFKKAARRAKMETNRQKTLLLSAIGWVSVLFLGAFDQQIGKLRRSRSYCTRPIDATKW